MKAPSDPFPALHPDSPPVPFHDSLHRGQAHALAGREIGMEPLEDLEESFSRGIGYSDAVVSDPKMRLTPFALPSDVDAPRPAGLEVVQGVRDEVGEDLPDRRHVASSTRKRSLGD